MKIVLVKLKNSIGLKICVWVVHIECSSAPTYLVICITLRRMARIVKVKHKTTDLLFRNGFEWVWVSNGFRMSEWVNESNAHHIYFFRFITRLIIRKSQDRDVISSSVGPSNKTLSNVSRSRNDSEFWYIISCLCLDCSQRKYDKYHVVFTSTTMEIIEKMG